MATESVWQGVEKVSEPASERKKLKDRCARCRRWNKSLRPRAVSGSHCNTLQHTLQRTLQHILQHVLQHILSPWGVTVIYRDPT